MKVIEQVPHKALTQPLSAYTVEVIEDPGHFNALEEEWNGLLRRTGIRHFQMTHEWLATWLRYFPPHQLFVILIRNRSGELVGAAPLSINRGNMGLCRRMLRKVQFIGSRLSIYDWMQCLLEPAQDEVLLLRLMADTLLRHRGRWEMVHLQYGSDHRQLAILQDRLADVCAESRIDSSMNMPYMTLPSTVEAYDKDGRKPKPRRNLRRLQKKLGDDLGIPYTLEFQVPCPETEASLTRFFDAHATYWTGKGRKSNFKRFPQLGRFYRDVFRLSQRYAGTDSPFIMFSILKSGDIELNYQLGFWQDGAYLDYMNTYHQDYREYGPGVIHKDAMILETIRRGGERFEFGRGDEPYKQLWATQSRPLWDLLAFRDRFSAALWSADTRLKQAIYRMRDP